MRELHLRSTVMDTWRALDISRGDQVKILLEKKLFEQLRTYARLRSALDLNGKGPLGSRGSRLDSGVCCQHEVHLLRAVLCVETELAYTL